MKSFKKKLIFNFMSIIFINFILIYFIFNFIMEGFIIEEVEKEFNNEYNNIISNYNFNNTYGDNIIQDTEQNIFSYSEIAVVTDEFNNITQHNTNQYDSDEDLTLDIDSSKPSFIDADMIIIDMYYNESLVSPPVDNEDIIMGYYLDNEHLLNYDEMVKVQLNNNTYYLMLTSILTLPDYTPITKLFYSNVTSLAIIIDTINKILEFILIISSLLTIFIGLYMTSQFENAVVRLCTYAENIGLGRFKKEVEPYEYEEFAKISKSLSNMSDMLYNYENKQKQFFQNVSHELRTPLMSIQGYSEGILENIIDKVDGAKVILSESKKMTNLVSELLYISRMDIGLEEINITPLNIKDTLYHCIETVKVIAEKFEKNIILDLSKQDIKLNADEDKLSRAIINILSNAIRHANSTVKILYYQENNNLKISIIDDGEGIPLNEITNIFTRFYKGENGNTGLGLSISKDIINAHGGNIEVENLNPGAKFTFTIPINKNT